MPYKRTKTCNGYRSLSINIVKNILLRSYMKLNHYFDIPKFWIIFYGIAAV